MTAHGYYSQPASQPPTSTTKITPQFVRFARLQIWDRSGITTRNCNWLMRHQQGLYFDFYVHEFLRFPNNGGPWAQQQLTLPWEVSEVESTQSWHQTVGHNEAKEVTKSASRSYTRFLFDLDLLKREQNDPRYKDSQHTLYYLGVAHCALVEAASDFYSPLLNPSKQLTGENLQVSDRSERALMKTRNIYEPLLN